MARARSAEPGCARNRADPARRHPSILDQLLPDAESVVLFWNPDCGFCRAIADDLRAYEAAHDESAPRLLVISTGTAEATRSEGFRSPVALDSAQAANAFDAHGTPMAVRITANGQIASPVAQGADQVLELMMTGSGAIAPARN
jgi:thiol-disulfide isomerase/thioredoxin